MKHIASNKQQPLNRKHWKDTEWTSILCLAIIRDGQEADGNYNSNLNEKFKVLKLETEQLKLNEKQREITS